MMRSMFFMLLKLWRWLALISREYYHSIEPMRQIIVVGKIISEYPKWIFKKYYNLGDVDIRRYIHQKFRTTILSKKYDREDDNYDRMFGR